MSLTSHATLACYAISIGLNLHGIETRRWSLDASILSYPGWRRMRNVNCSTSVQSLRVRRVESNSVRELSC